MCPNLDSFYYEIRWNRYAQRRKVDAEMANDMNNKLDTSGTHIWLRYTTQFTSGKRTHTIEVGIPVPIGASREVRERLIREAEVGMEQLADHMERRVEQMQRTQPMQVTPPAASPPKAAPAPVQTPSPSLKPPARVETPPAAEQREVTMPPTRSTIGASMPIAPGDMSSLPQFLQYISRELGLDARKAMELLGVKSLQGLNYREAFDQLQQLVAKEPPPTPSRPASQPARDTGSTGTPRAAAKAPPAPAPPDIGPAPLRLPSRAASSPNESLPAEPEPRVPAGVLEIKEAIVRGYPASGFDEEDDGFPDDNDADYLTDLSAEERALASDILGRLRDAHGSSQASDARLKVLANVVNNQVSDDQLEELIAGVWGTTTLKKLKNDQLEALIYWAKHADDFIAEVDMVLTLLQEEAYARSDR